MSMIEILNCEQNSPEWIEARLGVVTASQFATVMATGRGGGESKTRRTYMLKLIGERLTGEPADNFTNGHMERGHAMEPAARDAYAFVSGETPELIGFVRSGDIGASPDALVGDDGLMEIKTKLPHLQLDVLLKNEIPSEHTAQIQGQLWVCEREWVDFVSYWPGLPVFVKRAFRDEEFISKLTSSVLEFVDQMHNLEEQIRAMQ